MANKILKSSQQIVVRHLALILALLLFGLFGLGVFSGDHFQKSYLHSLYSWIRAIHSLILAKLPFASIYIILPIVIGLMVYYWKKSHFYTNNWLERLRKLLNICATWYTFFYLLWGMNYAGEPVVASMNMVKMEYDSLAFYQEFYQVSQSISEYRQAISADTSWLKNDVDLSTMEKTFQRIYNSELPKIGFKAFNNIRVRPLYPKGSLLVFSTAGIYIPYTFEGHFDPGMSMMQWPFTMAHEMAHGYGITDEGECNFLAYLVCYSQDDPFIRYSAELAYWRYMFFEALSRNEDKAMEGYQLLSQSVKADLKHIRQRLNAYPDFFPKLRNAIYEYYLKSNGVEKGMNSYNDLIKYVYLYKKSSGLPAFQQLNR